MKNGYYITSTGKRVELEPKIVLSLQHMSIVELVIPEGVRTVWCWNNQLTELILPDGVKYVYCSRNYIKKLVLPEGIKEVYCSRNYITNLILPKGIEQVNCDITALDINKHKHSKTDINLFTHIYTLNKPPSTQKKNTYEQ